MQRYRPKRRFEAVCFALSYNVSAGLGYDENRARDCLKRAGMGEKLTELDKRAEQDGSHDRLYSEHGKYRELWDAQAVYYQNTKQA